MSYLQKQMNFLKYDKRLLEINLKNGTITEDEFKNHLNALNDEADKAEKLDLEGDMESTKESMNGENHPADSSDPQPQQPENLEQNTTPTTNTNPDPFGSGY